MYIHDFTGTTITNATLVNGSPARVVNGGAMSATSGALSFYRSNAGTLPSENQRIDMRYVTPALGSLGATVSAQYGFIRMQNSGFAAGNIYVGVSLRGDGRLAIATWNTTTATVQANTIFSGVLWNTPNTASMTSVVRGNDVVYTAALNDDWANPVAWTDTGAAIGSGVAPISTAKRGVGFLVQGTSPSYPPSIDYIGWTDLGGRFFGA